MKTNMIHSRAASRLLAVAAVTCCACMAWAKTRVVQLPAGSVNGLAAAIASAGPGGTVIIKSGLHTESGTVTVGFRVNIIGESGAIVESSTPPDPDFPITIAAAIHLKNAPHAKVHGILFRPPASTTGSCGVIIENSPHAQVLNNHMNDLQFGVMVHRADHARISGNTIRVSSAWALDTSDPAFLIDTEGIVIINGEHVQVTDNHVAGGFDGIWMCAQKGRCSGNTVTENFIGLLLCRVAAGTFVISGADAEASHPGTAWLVHRNQGHDNDWGIQVTDGSHDNVLLNNVATGNHVYDCELTGDTLRYGYFVPGCFDNRVVQGGHTSLVVKDCGANNTIRGNVTLVDTNVDPCF